MVSARSATARHAARNTSAVTIENPWHINYDWPELFANGRCTQEYRRSTTNNTTSLVIVCDFFTSIEGVVFLPTSAGSITQYLSRHNGVDLEGESRADGVFAIANFWGLHTQVYRRAWGSSARVCIPSWLWPLKSFLPTPKNLSLAPFRWLKFMRRLAAPDAIDVREAMVAMHALRTDESQAAQRAAAAWAEETLHERARVISAT